MPTAAEEANERGAAGASSSLASDGSSQQQQHRRHHHSHPHRRPPSSAAGRASDQQKRDIGSFFREVDADDDGQIETHELSEYLGQSVGGHDFDTEREISDAAWALSTFPFPTTIIFINPLTQITSRASVMNRPALTPCAHAKMKRRGVDVDKGDPIDACST